MIRTAKYYVSVDPECKILWIRWFRLQNTTNPMSPTAKYYESDDPDCKITQCPMILTAIYYEFDDPDCKINRYPMIPTAKYYEFDDHDRKLLRIRWSLLQNHSISDDPVRKILPVRWQLMVDNSDLWQKIQQSSHVKGKYVKTKQDQLHPTETIFHHQTGFDLELTHKKGGWNKIKTKKSQKLESHSKSCMLYYF